MNLERLLTLGLEQAPIDPVLAGFTLRSTVIQHPIFQSAIREIARLHQRGIICKTWESLLLVAQSGTGKSTLFKYYKEQFPRRETAAGTEVPVLYVATPESPSVRDLAEAVLDAFGDPAADRGTTRAKTRRIINFVNKCKVEIILIDEFQHFADGNTGEARRVSNWLKLLTETIKRPVVLAGLPRSIAVVNRNPQLRRRLGSPYYMSPFEVSQDEHSKAFRSVLKKIHSLIPASCECPVLHSAEMANRFFYASMGLLDYVINIVDTAVSKVAGLHNGKVTLEVFAEAFKEAVWRFVPDELNPFGKNPIFRPLRKSGEPFESWDSLDKYTGANKRRGGGANGDSATPAKPKATTDKK